MADGQAREAFEDGSGEVFSARYLLFGRGTPFLSTK
jgi:hypothetical protein